MLKTIVNHTKNTWQPNRSFSEIYADSYIGKRGEIAVHKYITHNITAQYITYDNFRNDSYKKHAPFDALICSIYNRNIDEAIKYINNDIIYYGKIRNKTKEYLHKTQIYTVEIKTTRQGNRPILLDDFLDYPKYTRIDKDMSINNFIDYTKYINKHYNLKYSVNDMLYEEYQNLKDIYIRTYVKNDKVKIVGWINKKDFFKEMMIKHMYKKNKSEASLYFAVPLTYARNIADLSI